MLTFPETWPRVLLSNELSCHVSVYNMSKSLDEGVVNGSQRILKLCLLNCTLKTVKRPKCSSLARNDPHRSLLFHYSVKLACYNRMND